MYKMNTPKNLKVQFRVPSSRRPSLTLPKWGRYPSELPYVHISIIGLTSLFYSSLCVSVPKCKHDIHEGKRLCWQILTAGPSTGLLYNK